MKEILANFERIKELVNVANIDIIKFCDNNNKAAGTRVRKAMQEIKANAQEIRRMISEVKNDGVYGREK